MTLAALIKQTLAGDTGSGGLIELMGGQFIYSVTAQQGISADTRNYVTFQSIGGIPFSTMDAADSVLKSTIVSFQAYSFESSTNAAKMSRRIAALMRGLNVLSQRPAIQKITPVLGPLELWLEVEKIYRCIRDFDIEGELE